MLWTIWRFILRRLAKAQGFLDPMVVFSNLQHFSKPSEVWVPLELMRSGAVLQARGLINSQAIQHSLDKVWPFWVETQFDPNDKAFIPRAFSLTNINLTHRSWTAVGLPGLSDLPIVDPRGLVTPLFDGWSLDAWIIHEKGAFVPCRAANVDQGLDMDDTFAVTTKAHSDKFILESRAEVTAAPSPVLTVTYTARSSSKSWLMICVRPYNPEGISFIRNITLLAEGKGWSVNKKDTVHLDGKPSRYIFSNYHSPDLIEKAALPQEERPGQSMSCKTGMATSAAIYPLDPGRPLRIGVKVPLSGTDLNLKNSWPEDLKEACVLKVPDEAIRYLYESSMRTMVLHSPGDVYPGPFTYKRFWFRDAAFILQAMMAAGLLKRMEKIIDRFPSKQTPIGYFLSQDGEWDSNGQAIWTMKRYIDTTNGSIKPEWASSIYRAARWIERKRTSRGHDPLHAGLLPAGFSAEHFGPTDYYYWDDYWGVAGLRDASSLARMKNQDIATEFQSQADDMLNAIESSVASAIDRLGHPFIPACPSRRMDAAAVGSLVASYPLQIYAEKDERILQTARFLMDKYFLQGAFYYEISHSGINIYLTLHIAQVLLRAANPRFFEIVKAVAALASPTGQWPEAIHPKTKGGCMGDGQHVWACAEWVMMLRNMFVRHEQRERMLILCSGIPPEWTQPGETLFLGPTHTLYGEISVTVKVLESHIDVSWQAKWHNTAPRIEIRLPGHEPVAVKEGGISARIQMMEPAV